MTAQFSNSKGGIVAELLLGPGQVADDEAVSVQPIVLVLAQLAHIAQPLGHHPAGGGRDVDADPLATEILGGDQGGAAAAKGIENDVVRVALRVDQNAFKKHAAAFGSG